MEEGIAEIRRGLAAHRATGAALARPYWLSLLAEACGKGGQIEEGLRVLGEALAEARQSGQHVWEPERYRLKGEFLLMPERRTNASEAELCFRQALGVARGQHAKSPELRAGMSLSRLLAKQGKREDAQRLLAEIYGWFTEGFDTADLRGANTLLEELPRERSVALSSPIATSASASSTGARASASKPMNTSRPRP